MLPILLVAAFCAAAFFIGQQEATAKAKNPNLGKLRHVVLFAFKDDVSAEKQKEIEEASRLLINEIDVIQDLEWGTDLSKGQRSQGITHCLLMTFNSEEDLQTYLPHPKHEAFKKLAIPHLAKITVVDYIAQP